MSAPRSRVAGCGTNQAVITALRFPQCRVLGSDLSEQSLATARSNADRLGVTNLELRRESLNEVPYRSRFDYVMNTGVITVNADPVRGLTRLVAAMKPTGVLELMLYNQFHRVLTTAFQRALRAFLNNRAKPDLQRELPLAQMLVRALKRGALMTAFLKQQATLPDAGFADTMMQPVEHSYTVEKMAELAGQCELQLLSFCLDQFSVANNQTTWNMEFPGDPDLQARYDALEDEVRWHITNCLLLDKSPMLWFYLQRRDSPRPRKSEGQLARELLSQRFRRVKAEREVFVRGEDGSYSKTDRRLPFPQQRPRGVHAARLYEALDETRPLGETFRQLGFPPTFQTLHALRTTLTTTAFPYLLAQDD